MCIFLIWYKFFEDFFLEWHWTYLYRTSNQLNWYANYYFTDNNEKQEVKVYWKYGLKRLQNYFLRIFLFCNRGHEAFSLDMQINILLIIIME